MTTPNTFVRDEDLKPDEKEWLEKDRLNVANAHPAIQGAVVVGLIAFSFIGGGIRRAFFPSPLFPSEKCETSGSITVCTTDRGRWGHDTISFKPEQAKMPYTLDIKCTGSGAWKIKDKHEEITDDIANKYAYKWCKNF